VRYGFSLRTYSFSKPKSFSQERSPINTIIYAQRVVTLLKKVVTLLKKVVTLLKKVVTLLKKVVTLLKKVVTLLKKVVTLLKKVVTLLKKVVTLMMNTTLNDKRLGDFGLKLPKMRLRSRNAAAFALGVAEG
jgi:hypothetical protein